MNITGGSGKVTELVGFEEADEVAVNENNLTSVNFRDNDVVETETASGYEYVPEEETIDFVTIAFYATIGCAVLAIISFGTAFIIRKKGGKR